ncbi:hypothetical protein RD110_15860 [Rhodoferax koreense]|uniref:Uncharacterized protein n=1 Tax=Rhodoferax koreensis TaxID=1842727 RepID=A0A1P8JXL2_9BURK|nr:DUF4224 domain-containing protein [Rhodoferax koreense]APW38497.1 hypothetical protein RD110_15860 [Rhodoferax koreense]
MNSLLMTEEEILTLTGYKRPGDQEEELRKQGFYRARIGPTTGRVVLERAHYDAVCAGGKPATVNEPRVRPPTLRRKGIPA